MTRQFRQQFVGFAAALALSACAAPGPTPSNPPPAASVGTAPTATSSDGATKASPKAYGNYVRAVRGGQTLYCQRDADTSTRMVHESCLTLAQAQEENARNFMQGAMGIANVPVSPNAL
jgi:hypothetical protein